MSLTPEIAPSHVNIRELEERWGITRNALKHRAKSLGVELLRPTTKSTFWPGEQLQNGEDLHRWISTGNELAMFPGVLMAQGANTTSLRVVRPKNPVTDDRDMSLLTTAMVSLVQNQQATSSWDEIEAAADNNRPTPARNGQTPRPQTPRRVMTACLHARLRPPAHRTLRP